MEAILEIPITIEDLESLVWEQTTVIEEDTLGKDYNSKKYKTHLANIRSWRQS